MLLDFFLMRYQFRQQKIIVSYFFPQKTHHFYTIFYFDFFPAGLAPDGTRYKTDYRCEGDNMTLTCEDDSEYDLDEEEDDDPASIEVVRGNFGRFSIAVCNRHGRQVRITLIP